MCHPLHRHATLSRLSMSRGGLLPLLLIIPSLGILVAGCRGVMEHPDTGPPVSYFDPQAMAPAPVAMVSAAIPNPITVAAQDPEFVWNQLVDTVDDYFTISNERRVQAVGGLQMEGFIETRPQPGATWLEPWHWDSTSVDSRSLATLQSIRRTAMVRVIPVAGSYQVSVQVMQDLEDVERPAMATPGTTTPWTPGSSMARFDGSLVRILARPETTPRNLGWIPIGRDIELEQEILRDLQGRLTISPDE